MIVLIAAYPVGRLAQRIVKRGFRKAPATRNNLRRVSRRSVPHLPISGGHYEVADAMPWLILLAALGSQTSAIIGATMSRSDMLVSHQVLQRKVPRKTTFLILLLPAIALFLLADVFQAVALASRVFAAYFVLQAIIAWILARRRSNWGAVAGFTVVGAMMATIAVFGLPL